MSTPRGSARPAGVAAMQTPTTGSRRGPAQQPSSAGAAFRTPTTAGGIPTSRRTPGTAGGGLPSATRTPHALAARRALDTRRTAMFTPGGRASRRKSGRMLRDSPRDLLRNLSRRLAPLSQPVPSSSSSAASSPALASLSSSPGSARRPSRRRRGLTIDTVAEGGGRASSSARRPGESDDDDSLPLDSPRMSLLIADDDNDDLQPHRSVILEDDDANNNDADADADADFANFTSRSIELARRAATQEQLLQARRFSRASLGRSSFGSMRMSDYMDGYLGGDDNGTVGLGGVGGMDQIDLDLADEAQSAFFAEGAFDNLGPAAGADATFERLDSEVEVEVDEVARREGLHAGGRESAFGVTEAVHLDGNNEETTFMLGQQPGLSPDRTLGTELIAGDGETPAAAADGLADFGDLEDYYDHNENNGNMWQDDDDDDDDDNAGADEDVAVTTGFGAAGADGPGVVSAAAAARATRTEQGDYGGPRAKKTLRLSAHGIPYPSLPAGVIKRIAQTFAESSGAGRAKLSTETVAALSTATDYFFEQVGVDLQRYAQHAGRKTIDESDMLLLMRRQRVVHANHTVTPFSLAQRFLSRELLQELRMIPDTPVLKRRRAAAANNNKPQPRAQRLSSGGGRMSGKG